MNFTSAAAFIWSVADLLRGDYKQSDYGIVGFEIPFNRNFYEYTPPRSLSEINTELDGITKEILELLGEVHS